MQDDKKVFFFFFEVCFIVYRYTITQPLPSYQFLIDMSLTFQLITILSFLSNTKTTIRLFLFDNIISWWVKMYEQPR